MTNIPRLLAAGVLNFQAIAPFFQYLLFLDVPFQYGFKARCGCFRGFYKILSLLILPPRNKWFLLFTSRPYVT